MNRKQGIEAVLFLPAMAGVALLLYFGMSAIIKAGGWLLRGWFWLMTDLLALPRSAALALAVIAAALSVYALLHLAGRYRRRRFSRQA